MEVQDLLHTALLFTVLLCHAMVQQCFYEIYLYMVLIWRLFALTAGGTVCVGKEDDSLGEGNLLV